MFFFCETTSRDYNKDVSLRIYPFDGLWWVEGVVYLFPSFRYLACCSSDSFTSLCPVWRFNRTWEPAGTAWPEHKMNQSKRYITLSLSQTASWLSFCYRTCLVLVFAICWWAETLQDPPCRTHRSHRPHHRRCLILNPPRQTRPKETAVQGDISLNMVFHGLIKASKSNRTNSLSHRRRRQLAGSVSTGPAFVAFC